jgi:hypothetical protein
MCQGVPIQVPRVSIQVPRVPIQVLEKRRVRQAKLVTVPSEDQLLSRMDSGVYGSIALIIVIIYLSFDLQTLLFTGEKMIMKVKGRRMVGAGEY